MPPKDSEAVSEGNGPVPQQKEYGPGEPTLTDVYRFFLERFDRQQKTMDSCFDRQQKLMDSYFDQRDRKLDDMTKGTSQRAASLEHDARQPRLAMEADGPANTKTRERTETLLQQYKRCDSFSSCWVEHGPKINSTSFGMMAEHPTLPCRDDASPKSCLPPLKMRPPTPAGGLLPTGKTSTATETTVNEQRLQFYSTEGVSCKKTSTRYVSYDSSVWNLRAASSCRKIIETKSEEIMTFDPGGSQGRLRACPVLGLWRALLCGKVIRAGAAG